MLTEPDSFYIKIHNQISSSKNISEAKVLIGLHPEVLCYQVLDWGGSIVLHTTCSRQPENYELIKLLVSEGLKRDFDEFRNLQGGLLFCDLFQKTPLNIIVHHNSIRTIQQLVKNQPSLMAPNHIVKSRLFDSVHSTYHLEMARYLIQLYPDCISSYDPLDERNNQILLYYICGKIRDPRFLLRLVSLIIEEGLRQNIGGEHSIGGLFMIHEWAQANEYTAADLLIERRNQSWKVLHPIIRAAIGNDAPILHGAILGRNHRHIHDICEHIGHSAFTRDSNGRLPIHLAAEEGLRWDLDGLDAIVRCNVDALGENDPVTGLPVCALAAEGEKYSLNSIYELILLDLDHFT